MIVDEAQLRKTKSLFGALETARLPWWVTWREIADYYMPKRYNWLLSDQERAKRLSKNGNIIDGTGTNAGKVLAAGMMNGITSPTRPWFKLRLADFEENAGSSARRWLDEVERRLLLIMAESNFYNALAVMYLDLVFFGTAAVLIYEDRESVIRCYNNALGEFFLGQSSRQQVNVFAREITRTVRQTVEEWGIENVSDRTKIAYRAGNARLTENLNICHIIEPNDDKRYGLPKHFTYREVYYEKASQSTSEVLSVKGYYELPGIFPRWEITGNDDYGTGPGLDALGDVIQLQHESKRKAQSLDYMVRPPMVLDVELQRRGTALIPGGQTFVKSSSNVGAKPAYQVNPPIQELTQDLMQIQSRIRETFHNDLFKMISQLETVRTATEIDARKEEKLIMLGPVLDRFKTEALDPGVNRIFNIAQRAGLLPSPPPEYANAKIEINYISILATAQSAVGVIPTERFVQFIGSVAGVYPNALHVPDWDSLLRDYGRDLGVKAKHINPAEKTAQLNAEAAKAAQAQELAASVEPAAGAAKLLSETDVGGGANALQMMLGG